MRVRRFAAGVAVLALALAMTGCTRNAPEITDAQVEEWRDLATESIPLATDITIEADKEATMAGSVNLVFVTVHFASFADLKASVQAVSDVEATIDESSGAAVSSTLVNDGNAKFTAEVDARLMEGVPGLAGSKVFTRDSYTLQSGTVDLTVAAYVYVADPGVVDPAWLDTVATITDRVASDAGGQIDSIVILPEDAFNLHISDAEIDAALIPVAGLPGMKGAGVDNGCLRTDTWAYDLTYSFAIVYPAGAREGACA
jgi:hypothetical protein